MVKGLFRPVSILCQVAVLFFLIACGDDGSSSGPEGGESSVAEESSSSAEISSSSGNGDSGSGAGMTFNPKGKCRSKARHLSHLAIPILNHTVIPAQGPE